MVVGWIEEVGVKSKFQDVFRIPLQKNASKKPKIPLEGQNGPPLKSFGQTGSHHFVKVYTL